MLVATILCDGLIARAPSLCGSPTAAVRWRPRAPVAHASATSLLADEAAAEGGLNAAVITDTLLDLGVYTLLAGVVALTAYSLYVTLDQSNKEYGGWSPRDEFDDGTIKDTQGTRLRKGGRYDPVTDTWTYAKQEPTSPRVGRAASQDAALSGSDGSEANRYDRRMQKKRKQAQKSRKRRR